MVYTPARLARLTVERTIERCGFELHSPSLRVIDPAVGAGAFLAAMLAIAPDGKGTIVGIDRDASAIASTEALLRPALGSWRGQFHLGDALATSPQPHKGATLVIGNPPWAARAAERSKISDALLEDFKRTETGALNERRIGVLSDIYIRFLRWSAEAIRLSSEGGAFGLLTNRSFLDGPVHRGVRAALRRWFDRIEVIDFGGAALRARSSEKGAVRDENIFGVRTGVALTMAVREPGAEPRAGHVRVLSLKGTKESKLRALEMREEHPGPTHPELWIPREDNADWPIPYRSLAEVFPFHREGLQSNRDRALTGESKAELLERMRAFANGIEDAKYDEALLSLRTAKSHYDPEHARRIVREALAEAPAGEGWILPIAYRPFDHRFIVTLSKVCHRPRAALQRAVSKSPWSLLSTRKDPGAEQWRHFGAAFSIADSSFLSTRSSSRTRVFPAADADGNPNLSEEAHAVFGSAEEALSLSLALLASTKYQRRFSALLRRDYPRIPMKQNGALSALGAELAMLFRDAPGEANVFIGDRQRPAPNELPTLLKRIDEAVDVAIFET